MILVLKLVIKLISLNIHLISETIPYVHKTKEAMDLSATNGNDMKPIFWV
jgi:hypothetical protein